MVLYLCRSLPCLYLFYYNCKGSGCTNSDQIECDDEVNDDGDDSIWIKQIDREHYCHDFKFSATYINKIPYNIHLNTNNSDKSRYENSQTDQSVIQN